MKRQIFQIEELLLRYEVILDPQGLNINNKVKTIMTNKINGFKTIPMKDLDQSLVENNLNRCFLV